MARKIKGSFQRSTAYCHSHPIIYFPLEKSTRNMEVGCCRLKYRISK